MRYSDKIGRHIRSVRESRGYSQEYMAEMLDMVQSSYANLESGKSSMSVDRLLQICDILQLDVHTLLDESGRDAHTVRIPRQQEKTTFALTPEIRTVYEQFISELQSEIEFLRGLVRRREE